MTLPLLLAACLLGAPSVPTAPQEKTAPSLDAALADVRAQLARDDARHAGTALDALFREHAGDPALKEHRDELLALLTERDFLRRYRPPALKDLLPGEVLTASDRSGKFKLRHRFERTREARSQDGQVQRVLTAGEQMERLLGEGWEDRFGEAQEVKAAPLYPVPFAGAFEVDLKGTMPEDVGSPVGMALGTVALTVVLGPEEVFEVQFGSPGVDVGGTQAFTQPRIVRSPPGGGDGEGEVLDENQGPSFRFGQEYAVSLEVGARKLVAKVEGHTILQADKPEDAFGRFTIRTAPSVEEVQIEGTVDPAWVKAQRARFRGRALAAFAADHDATDELPAELR